MTYIQGLLMAMFLCTLSVNLDAFRFNYKCNKEEELIKQRFSTMQQSISTFMGYTRKVIKKEQLPHIGISFSGGGWVAAIAELAMLQALEDMGLLGGVASIATSSGSTWALSSWLKLSAQHKMKAPIEDVTAYLKPRLAEGFIFNEAAVEDYLDTFVKRHNRGLPFDVTCIWGEALTRQFLDDGDDRSAEHWLHETHDIALSGNLPLPLFTSLLEPERSCVSAACGWAASWVKEQPKQVRAYLEYSPFITRLFGSSQHCIPTHELNVTWNYLLGTWGSAYAGSFYDDLELADNMLKGKTGLGFMGIVQELCSCFGTNPLSPAIPNFMKKMDGPFKGQKYLRPVDSGIELKVPFPPVLERGVNIMIVGDVSSDSAYTGGRQSMDAGKNWADARGIPFPVLPDDTTLTDDTPDIIIDKAQPEAPIIIYFKGAPAVMQPKNDDTLFAQIYDDMYTKVTENHHLFEQAIRYYMRNHHKHKKA